MKQLSQLVLPEYNSRGELYYACNITKIIPPVLIRLTHPNEVLNDSAFYNKNPDLWAVVCNDDGSIPKASKFNTIRTKYTVLFNTLEECNNYFNLYYNIEYINNIPIYKFKR